MAAGRSATGSSPLLAALAVKPFRRFWVAATVSLLGDQLTLIALPWLVLKLTGDALAMLAAGCASPGRYLCRQSHDQISTR